MVRAEFLRRFAGQPETVALGDGAAWIWKMFWINFPWAVQIVDFHHAAEHVASLAELVHPRDSSQWKKLRRNWTAKLWNGKLDALLTSARAAIPSSRKKAKAGRKALSEPPASTIRTLWTKWLGTTILDELSRIECAAEVKRN